MFKYLIAPIILATTSFAAIDCSDSFKFDSESTFLKDGLIVYSSANKARIYNLSTSECLVSFEGSNIDYPIASIIFTFGTIQAYQTNKWEELPQKVAIDYTEVFYDFDDFEDFEDDKVCDTKSDTYRMSTVGNVNCYLILQLHKVHDSDKSEGFVVGSTIVFYMIFIGFFSFFAYVTKQNHS